jgi:integrase
MTSSKLTTADYLDFNFTVEKAKDLIQNPKTEVIGSYIAIAIYTGLRFSDLIKLDWSVFHRDSVTITEQKTGKVRVITFSKNLLEIISPLRKENGLIFLSQKGVPYEIQSINRILKTIFKNQLLTKNISTHTMRKTYGRRVWEMNNRSEAGLIALMDLFNHSSLKITKAYLGITAEDRANIYLNL